MLKSFPLAVIALAAGLASAQAQDSPAAPATTGATTVTPPAKVVEPTMVQPMTSAPAVDSNATTDMNATGTTAVESKNPNNANATGKNGFNSTGANTVDPTGINKVDAPLKGANSFTESQARSRIEKNGFSAITGLMKDSDGIWRGKAMKDGRTMDVALDYKGEIVAH